MNVNFSDTRKSNSLENEKKNCVLVLQKELEVSRLVTCSHLVDCKTTAIIEFEFVTIPIYLTQSDNCCRQSLIVELWTVFGSYHTVPPKANKICANT